MRFANHAILAIKTPLGAFLVAAVLLSGTVGVHATVTQSVSTESQKVSSANGTIELVDGSLKASVSSQALNLLPGATVSRTLHIRNSATFDFASIAMTVVDTTPTILTTNTTHGLQISVDRCNSSYSSCVNFISSKPVMSKTTSNNTVDNISGALTSGENDYIRVNLYFPSSADATYLGLDSNLTYTFTATQVVPS